MASNFEAIGKQFVELYYSNMKGHRDTIVPLYEENALMTYEGAQCQGRMSIQEKLNSLTFKTIQHNITTVDSQPVLNGNSLSLFITVMGQLKTDDDPPHSFSQSFILRMVEGGGFCIANDVFRMILH